ncbi:MAG: hypothetical protein V3V08_25685 [Nannocystaceae bacterium]
MNARVILAVVVAISAGLLAGKQARDALQEPSEAEKKSRTKQRGRRRRRWAWRTAKKMWEHKDGNGPK